MWPQRGQQKEGHLKPCGQLTKLGAGQDRNPHSVKHQFLTFFLPEAGKKGGGVCLLSKDSARFLRRRFTTAENKDLSTMFTFDVWWEPSYVPIFTRGCSAVEWKLKAWEGVEPWLLRCLWERVAGDGIRGQHSVRELLSPSASGTWLPTGLDILSCPWSLFHRLWCFGETTTTKV